MSKKIFISAGEASGEHYGALLIDALRRRLAEHGQEAHFFGMGGARMQAAGLQPAARVERMAVMGLTEVVRHLPRIWAEFRRLRRAMRQGRPDVAILIDFPDIHFRLAKELHRMGVPVIFFVSPQLWAWKKYRLKLVEQYVDRMLVIFPFEEDFYREHGVASEFVGHPLAELPRPQVDRAAFAAAHGLDPAADWIGLLPGSRAREIRDHLPEMIEAAWKLEEQTPTTESRLNFLVPLAPTLTSEQRRAAQALVERHGGGLHIRLVDDARATLALARASIVASGTATVEAALIGNPFVVVYRVSPVTYSIAKRIVKVPHVAMVNLIAQKRLVPELIQSEFTASNMMVAIARLLPDGPDRQSMMEELACLRDRLTCSPAKGASGAIDRVAAVALELAGRGAR